MNVTYTRVAQRARDACDQIEGGGTRAGAPAYAVAEPRRQRVEIVCAELVALRMDTRTDDGSIARGLPTAVAAQRPHGLRDHARLQAAPAGVRDTDAAGWIEDDHRRAIGDLYAQHRAGNPCHGRIGGNARLRSRFVDDHDFGTVLLTQPRPCARGDERPAGVKLLWRLVGAQIPVGNAGESEVKNEAFAT